VDTGFKRTTQPILALPFMEGHRRLPVPKDITNLPAQQKLPLIQAIIQHHYEHSGGKLDMRGKSSAKNIFILIEDRSSLTVVARL
jgi:hypothetical protein